LWFICGSLMSDYSFQTEDTEQQIIRETFHLVSKRDENVCNFLEGGLLIGGSENKLIYRHYATLYFVFVETLDKCFENVCELDLIFHLDKVHNILAEMVMGGMVLETNMSEIITQVEAQGKMEKSEVRAAPSAACACPRMPFCDALVLNVCCCCSEHQIGVGF
ncbi:hypothetical protein cypCar_00041215, partial [Cyprinus carpio]